MPDNIVEEIFSLDFTGDPKNVHILADEVERLQKNVDDAKKSGVGLEAAVAKLSVAQKKLIEVTLGSGKATKESTKATQEGTKATETNNKTTLKGVDAFKALRAEIKAYKAAAIQAGEDTPIGQEFIKKAAEATDRLGDLNQSILNVSKDTRNLNTVAEGARTFTAALQVGQGVIAQFGGNSKELQEILVKLQGTQAILSGLTEIQNALQKESALITGLNAAKKTLLAGVTTGLSAAETVAIVTTNALNASLSFLTGGAFLAFAIVTSLVAAIYQYATATTAAERATKNKLEIDKEALRIDELFIAQFEKRTAGLIKQKEFLKELSDAEELSIAKRRAANNALIDEQLKLLNIEKGFVRSRKELDDIQAKIDDAKHKRIIDNTKFDQEQKQVQIDLEKRLIDLRQQTTDTLISIEENEQARTISQIVEGFERRKAAIQAQIKEEAKLRKDLTAQQIKDLNDAEIRLLTANEQAKAKAIADAQKKFRLEDIKHEEELIAAKLALRSTDTDAQKSLIIANGELRKKAAAEEIKDKIELGIQLAKIEQDTQDQINAVDLKTVNDKLKVNEITQSLVQTGFRDRLSLIEQERQLKLQANELEIKSEEEKAAAIKKINEDADKARRQAILAQIQLIQDTVGKVAGAGADFFNQQAQSGIEQTDALIASQQAKVDAVTRIAEKGNAEQLQLEQERLDALNKKKEQFVRQQQALAVIELVANTTVAVAKAAAEGGAAAPFTIAATLIALVAGLAKARALASESAFAGGIIDLQGPGTSTSDSIPAWLSKGESVMTAEETYLFRPTLEAIRNGDVLPHELNDFATGNFLDNMLAVPFGTIQSGMDTASLEGRIMDLHDAILSLPEEIGKFMPETQFNITEEGIHTIVSKREKRKQEINKRAR